MHPLVTFAIADLEQSQRAAENNLIWRNRRESAASPAAVERDGRWARAIARWASTDRDSAADCCETASATV